MKNFPLSLPPFSDSLSLFLHRLISKIINVIISRKKRHFCVVDAEKEFFACVLSHISNRSSTAVSAIVPMTSFIAQFFLFVRNAQYAGGHFFAQGNARQLMQTLIKMSRILTWKWVLHAMDKLIIANNNNNNFLWPFSQFYSEKFHPLKRVILSLSRSLSLIFCSST